jgi:hypothetical protein
MFGKNCIISQLHPSLPPRVNTFIRKARKVEYSWWHNSSEIVALSMAITVAIIACTLHYHTGIQWL